MKYILSAFLIVFVLASCSPEHSMEQAVSGKMGRECLGDWKMNKLGEIKSYPASIPGVVHTDLLANNLIEDPFYGNNEEELQWIGEASWVYSTIITPDPGILEKENIELVFEGLDTYAEVFLNDTLILSADNMFRTWIVDVKGILHDGENSLSVIFSPAREENEKKAAALSYKLPDNRAFTRKSPYHFGWDWGPEFVTCGIWKPVYLNAWDNFQIDHVHVQYGDIDTDPLPIIFRIHVISDQEQTVSVKIFNEENEYDLAAEKVDLSIGNNDIVIRVEIEDPQLWWPLGLGPQNLYTFRTRIESNGVLDEVLSSIGIREVELVREPDDFGESFFFVVNGLPVFMKGANYVPQDNFLPRVDTARYERLIRSVVDANMNTLRVWGGGFYENDIFYELCDRNGILIWQDFMFACNMYPGDDAFVENVKQEAIDNVSRLSNHPCIALWCGNNEIDEGWHNWGWQQALEYSEQDSAKVWNDYLKVFHDILPSAVDRYDPGSIYWPSSPMTGWGRDEAYTMGDVHYWGVWWGEEPFEMYREKIGRFSSEYGFQGMPPMETINSFSETEDQYIGSEIMESHQKHPRGTELIQTYMEREFIIPDKFEDYIYVSQVLQAEGMGQAFFTHRIAQPHCMGTLYWQLNDCWPVTSWSGLDYFGRWKALHYHVKRAFEPIMVRAVVQDGDILVLAVNDHPEGQALDLMVELMDFNGEVILKNEEHLECPPQSNQLVFSIPSHGQNSDNVVFIARLIQDGKEVSNSFLYFVPTKEMKLQDPGITFEVTESGSGPKVIIHTDRLARQVFLEARGLDGRFDDNFFDMAAGESREIIYQGESSGAEIAQKLKIKSIYDTYN